MGMVGWGRAFNLRFMPRTAPRLHVDSFWHRPHLPRGGSLFINETTNVQIGPSGFWGFMTGLSQGLFGGGWFGMNNTWNMQTPTYTNPLAMLNAGAYPQGTTQAQSDEDNYLKTLTQVLGSKGTFAKHPDKENFYIMTTKDGKVIEDTFQNLLDKFKENETLTNTNTNPTNTNTDPTNTNTNPTNTNTNPTNANTDPTNTNTDPANTNTDPTNRSVTPKTKSYSGHIKDWYKAAGNDEDGAAVLNAIRPGMSARQVTDLILNNKVNYLSAEDRNALAEKVLKNNPSVFENGKVKDGFERDKLDIPTIKYIKENYVKSRDFADMKSTGEYQNKNGGIHKITSTINGKFGRIAKLEYDNDARYAKWHYYAQDGTELNAETIKATDSELYNRTHGE